MQGCVVTCGICGLSTFLKIGSEPVHSMMHMQGERQRQVPAKFIIFNTQFLVLNTRFIGFDTKFLVLNTKFLVLNIKTHRR